MKRRVAFLALVLGFSVLACQVIAGIDRVATEDRPPDPPDVFEAAPPTPPVPDPCAHIAPPPPPLTDDEPAIENQLESFEVAMREFHLLAKNDGGGLIGFDLDGVCTCDDRAGAAHTGAPSCAGPTACDPDGGIDNGTKALFDKFGTLVPDVDEAAGLNNSVALGQSGILIEIANYNGRANDRAVNVGFIISHGIYDGGGCATDADGGPPPYPPGWCGNDIWTVDPAAVAGERAPYASVVSAPAYVTNYTLVINDPTGYFEVPFGDVSLRLYSPILVATIVPLDASGNPRDPKALPSGKNDRDFRLDDGLLAGRLAASSILAAVGAFHVPHASDPDAGETFFCQAPAYSALAQAMCGARDIASSQPLDFDPKVSCDAVSATTSFRALPATVGDKRAGATTINPCVLADGGPDASFYQCPSGPSGTP